MKARDNPFAAQRIERLAFRFPPGDGWTAFLSRLEANAWRGAITGPHGAGKTTLLEQLAARLAARGFHPRLLTLRAESTAAEKRALLAPVRAPDFVLFDGAEQLGAQHWLAFRRATRDAAGCVITLHRPARLRTVLEMAPTDALLEELAHELSGAHLPAGEAGHLLLRHAGNVRECLRELYDRCATSAPRVVSR